jgi:signal transduction histidine kinase
MNADQNRIQRVLVSLLKSASKSTQKGAVVLSVSRESVDGVDWINFNVIDSGPGISPEVLRSLFKDYTQADAVTSSVYGGTALAVAICQRFSFMMGGNVFVESEPGKGATFTFRIPAEMQVHLAKSHVVRATNRLIRDLLDLDIKEKDA